MTAKLHDAPLIHRYAVGAMVRLGRSSPLPNAATGPYEVLATLPERDGDLQYRIKSNREPFQRIASEDQLELA
jgi:hypothetical protein